MNSSSVEFSKVKDTLKAIENELVEKINELEKGDDLVDQVLLLDKLNHIPKVIRFNVGGEKFATLSENIFKFKESLLYLLIFQAPLKQLEQEIALDRSPKYFEIILDFLKHNSADLTNLNQSEKLEMMNEALYYNIEGLDTLVLCSLST